jgi:homoserine kinase type II
MAVYTEVDDGELAAFIGRYDVGELTSYKGIAEGVENSNYLVHTTGGSFILTLYEKRVDPADLPFFLGLMHHLAAAGIPCPTPVETRDGTALGRLAGRPAALITFLEGMWIRRPRNRHCAELGSALAAMHIAAGDFEGTRHNALSRDAWRALFEQCRAHADSVHGGLATELDRELDALSSDWPRKLPTGVIHADLFPDNVFFLGDRLSGIIDFYFACTDAFAYDIAICLNAWCFESDGAFNITKARALLSAYEAKRPLNEAEHAALPLLARGSAMRFLLTRLYDWVNTPGDALVKRKDPIEYLKKLRFHRSVASAGEYGLDR